MKKKIDLSGIYKRFIKAYFQTIFFEDQKDKLQYKFI